MMTRRSEMLSNLAKVSLFARSRPYHVPICTSSRPVTSRLVPGHVLSRPDLWDVTARFLGPTGARPESVAELRDMMTRRSEMLSNLAKVRTKSL